MRAGGGGGGGGARVCCNYVKRQVGGRLAPQHPLRRPRGPSLATKMLRKMIMRGGRATRGDCL